MHMTARIDERHAPTRPEEAPAELHSEDLLAGAPAVLIHHEGKVYTLRATRQGKLLLTK